MYAQLQIQKHQRPQPHSVSGVSTGMDACTHAQATNSLLCSSVARPALSPLPPLTGSHDGFPLEPRGATTASGSGTPSTSSSSRPPPAAAHRHHSLSEEADVDAHIAGHVVGDLDQASYAQHLNTQRTTHPPTARARTRTRRSMDRQTQPAAEKAVGEESGDQGYAVCFKYRVYRCWRHSEQARKSERRRTLPRRRTECDVRAKTRWRRH